MSYEARLLVSRSGASSDLWGPEVEPFETELAARGSRYIAGLDEVGRGALFGPVLAAAVVLRSGAEIEGLRDSKQLTAKQRRELFLEIDSRALDWAVGIASAAEIDRINILRATRLAMKRAIRCLRHPPDHLLIDALELADVPIPQTAIVKGDARCRSVAAASIMAKCARDGLMQQYGRRVPGYGLRHNMGYATVQHRAAIMRRGFSELHRRSFRVQGTLPFDVED